MTVYEKLTKARLAFQQRGVKMSGKNDFAGYVYYELADILPAINEIGCELGFACLVSFTPSIATLQFMDSESGEYITFTSPMSEANLKGCHAVQNLGAVETYIKRYLYQNAFEIVESDSLNKTHNPNEKPTKQEHAPEKSDYPTAKDECARISAELKLSDDDKKELWDASSRNYSNLLIMLKEKEKEAADKLASIDKTLSDVWDAAKNGR